MTTGQIFVRIKSHKVGESYRDITRVWQNTHYIYIINSFIKLGYIERGNFEYIKIIKEIPKDLFNKDNLVEAAKGLRLPKKNPLGMWSKTVTLINGNLLNIGETIKVDYFKISHRIVYHGVSTTIRSYISLLEKLEYIEHIETEYNTIKSYSIIKILKFIPDGLTLSLAKKMAYDETYRRAFKIKALKKRINEKI